jgi:hypothetical protein
MPKAKVTEPVAETSPTMAGLTAGRIVIYVDLDGNHRAAVVTTVCDAVSGHVNLFVFPDGARPYDLANENGATPCGVMFDDGKRPPRSWHWVEQV